MNTCPYCASPMPDHADACPTCGAARSDVQLPTGTRLNDQYTLERVLGQGGFGITYLAQDTVLGRRVALKELFPDGSTRRGQGVQPPASLGMAGFTEARTRFLEEARTLARFNHPGIVRVFDVFEEHNTAYLVMEALEGETLGQRINRLGKLDEQSVKTLALSLAGALEVVHDAGLLHRDIKPDNIFLTNDGRTVLIDFGSARQYTSSRTMNHTRLVTPGYAAPEQYASSAKFGPYTDVYGLAATLYHALMGFAPPSAPDRFVGVEVPRLPNGTTNLQAVLERSLSLKAQDRPSTIPIFHQDVNDTKSINVQHFKTEAPKKAFSKVIYRRGDIEITETSITIGRLTYPLKDFDSYQISSRNEAADYKDDSDVEKDKFTGFIDRMLGYGPIKMTKVYHLNLCLGEKRTSIFSSAQVEDVEYLAREVGKVIKRRPN